MDSRLVRRRARGDRQLRRRGSRCLVRLLCGKGEDVRRVEGDVGGRNAMEAISYFLRRLGEHGAFLLLRRIEQRLII